MSYADITRAVGAEHVRDLRREAGEAVRASLARCGRRARLASAVRRTGVASPGSPAACAC